MNEEEKSTVPFIPIPGTAGIYHNYIDMVTYLNRVIYRELYLALNLRCMNYKKMNQDIYNRDSYVVTIFDVIPELAEEFYNYVIYRILNLLSNDFRNIFNSYHKVTPRTDEGLIFRYDNISETFETISNVLSAHVDDITRPLLKDMYGIMVNATNQLKDMLVRDINISEGYLSEYIENNITILIEDLTFNLNKAKTDFISSIDSHTILRYDMNKLNIDYHNIDIFQSLTNRQSDTSETSLVLDIRAVLHSTVFTAKLMELVK